MILIESRGSCNSEFSLHSYFFSAAFILVRGYKLSKQLAGSRVRARHDWLIRAIHKRPLAESPFILAHSSVDRSQARWRRQSEVARFRTLIFAYACACNPLRSNRWVSLIRSVRSGLPLYLDYCQFVIAWSAKAFVNCEECFFEVYLT